MAEIGLDSFLSVSLSPEQKLVLKICDLPLIKCINLRSIKHRTIACLLPPSPTFWSLDLTVPMLTVPLWCTHIPSCFRAAVGTAPTRGQKLTSSTEPWFLSVSSSRYPQNLLTCGRKVNVLGGNAQPAGWESVDECPSFWSLRGQFWGIFNKAFERVPHETRRLNGFVFCGAKQPVSLWVCSL